MKKLQAFLRSSAIIITTNGDKHKSTVSENRIFVVSFVRITHPVFVINDEVFPPRGERLKRLLPRAIMEEAESCRSAPAQSARGRFTKKSFFGGITYVHG